MTLATTPTSQIAVPPATERMIAARWEMWRGPMTAWMAIHNPYTGLHGRQADHREWLLTLLHRGIPMYAIRRLALDDPREARLVLMAKAERYQDKMRKRKPYAYATRTGNEQGSTGHGTGADYSR